MTLKKEALKIANKDKLEQSLLKTGAFKQRTDFYTINQLVNLDATFAYVFGHTNPLFRKLLVAKLSDECLLQRSQ